MPVNTLTPTNLDAGAAGFSNSQPGFLAFTPIWINGWVLDNGLLGLKSNADSVYLCSQQPVDFTSATVTYGLGSYSFGVGNVFGAPSNGTPDGRMVTSGAIFTGNITANGLPTFWAVIDTANTRLLATGPISGGGNVTSGNHFSLTAVVVHIPGTQNPYTQNPVLLPNLSAAIARSRSGGTAARILVNAHSYGAGGGITGLGTQVAQGYGPMLQNYLPAQGVTTIWNAIMGDYNSEGVAAVPASAWDNRVAIGSDWILLGNWILGGKMYSQNAGGTSTYDFTPGFVFNHARIWGEYATTTSLNFYVDGVQITTGLTESSTAATVEYIDLTGVSGRKISVQTTGSGNAYLNQIECFTSGQIDAVLAVSGNAGQLMARLADTSQAWSSGLAVPLWQPDAMILDCVTNDVMSATAPSAFQTSTQSIVSSLPNTDIILFIDPVGTNANFTNGVYASLITALQNVAAANPNCVIFDSRTVMGNTFNAALMNADGVHPNAAGHLAISKALAAQIGLWLGKAVSTTPVIPNVILNNANLSIARTAYLNARLGNSQMNILHDGSSETRGYQGNWSGVTNPYTSANSYVGQLSSFSLSIPQNNANMFGADVGDMNATFDPRFNIASSGGWSQNNPINLLGGYWFSTSQASKVFQFTPTTQTDTVDVYYFTGSANGSFQVWSYNGATQVTQLGTINTNIATGFSKQTFTFNSSTANSAALVTTSNSNLYICGLSLYYSTAYGISHINAGFSASTAAQNSDTTNPLFGPLIQIGVVAAPLVFLEAFADVNVDTGGTNISAYMASMQTIINTIQAAGGNVVLLTKAPMGTSVVSATVQLAYVNATKSLGASNNLAVIDLYHMFGSYAAMQAAGQTSDVDGNVHPNTMGYAAWANLVHSFISAYIAN